jgi:TorA maturation chaperone TorD
LRRNSIAEPEKLLHNRGVMAAHCRNDPPPYRIDLAFAAALASPATSHPDGAEMSDSRLAEALDENDAPALDEIDRERAQEFALLAALLVRAPDAALLGRIAGLQGNATPLGHAHAALAEMARAADAGQVAREFFDLFIGVGRGELLPYGSYYMTGFLHERPLARLRADLEARGIQRAEGMHEPEDHAGILCEIMAGLIGREFAATPEEQQQFFEKHLAPWIGRFFVDLEMAERADFYRHVGALGRIFIGIETEAFALPG